MEHSKSPWKVMILNLESSGKITDRSVYVVSGDHQILQMNCELPIEEQIANAEYIVKSANAYSKLIKIANLAAGMIMSINTPITAKVGDNIAVPEPQAILLRKIESLLTKLGEMPEKERTEDGVCPLCRGKWVNFMDECSMCNGTGKSKEI